MKRKLAIIGIGAVGSSCAFSLMIQDIASEIVLVDANEKKLEGEVMDLQHGLPALFHPSVKIIQGKIETCTDCDVIIITAGTKQNPGQNRHDLINKNIEIFKSFVPQLKQYSPKAVLIVVSNPVDEMAYIAWKLSGLPPSQVLGSGTLLDTYRFKHILGDKIKVNPRDITAFIVGAHGDGSVPVVSKVTSDLLEILSIEKIDYKSIHKEVIQSRYDIVQKKRSYQLCNCFSNH